MYTYCPTKTGQPYRGCVKTNRNYGAKAQIEFIVHCPLDYTNPIRNTIMKANNKIWL